MSYNKKVWKSGDRITKEALNNMENGIEAAHQNSGGTGSVSVVDNLNSDSSTSALSAKQGKELNNKMPAKSIVEGGKIYLAKEDGTKLDSGTELPAGGSTIEVVNNLESDSTTAALSAAQGKALNTQYKDIANYSLVKHTDGKVYIKKQDGTLVGTGVEVGNDTDLSKVSMTMSGQTLKLLNNGVQITTVEIPTAVVTDEQLTSIIQSKIDDGTLSALTIEDNSITYAKLANDIKNKLSIVVSTESKTETIDTLTNKTAANYIAYTESCGYVLDKDVKLNKVAISCKSGETVKFMIFSATKKYPDSSTNNTMTYTKVSEIGEVTANNNNIAELILQPSVTLPAGNVVIAFSPNKKLGYINAEGNKGEVYAYNKDLSTSDTFDGNQIGTSTQPRPIYILEYITGAIETTKDLKDVVKDVNTNIETLKNSQDTTINTVNQHTSEINTINQTLSNKDNNDYELRYNLQLRKPINKYFVLIVDDVTRSALTIADTLIENDIYPAFGLKMESITGNDITWEEVKQLQDKGFEIFFHGMLHSHTPVGTSGTLDDVMKKDIEDYKALCKEHGIYIKGYGGPNHYQLPTSCFREFEWARSAYGLTAYGGGGHMSTTFANIVVMSAEITSSAQDLTSFKNWSQTVEDNQYITPMCHNQNLVGQIAKYIELFNKWKEDGLVCIRPCDAVRQSLWDSGSIGQNSTFEIQAGTATGSYFIVAKNGKILTNQNI